MRRCKNTMLACVSKAVQKGICHERQANRR
jgi:hypothetical protein